MKTRDFKILQITEPTIKLQPLAILNYESDEGGGVNVEHTAGSAVDASKFYYRIPMVNINGFNLSMEMIEDMTLDVSGFIPTFNVTFLDKQNQFASKYFPKDGSTMSFYMATPGSEKDYKPIRLDFIITSLHSSGSVGKTSQGDPCIFTVGGEMKLPKAMGKFNYVLDGSSFESLLKLSQNLELGFASNIEQTNDNQIWLNEYQTLGDYLEHIISHSYIDDENFMNGFIDQYYVLNFVEVDRLFCQDGNKEDEPCKIYNTSLPIPEIDESAEPKQNEGLEKTSEKDDGITEMDSYYYLTNGDNGQEHAGTGWTNYIVDYSVINKSASTLYNGFRKYVQYYDFTTRQFISEYVDPISYNTEGMISLNKGPVENGESGDDMRDNLASYTNFCSLDDNVHENYHWAKVLNEFSYDECTKVGLEVKLDSFNPAITRFSRIWVDLYEKNASAVNDLSSKEGNDDVNPNEEQTVAAQVADKDNNVPNEEEHLKNVPSGVYNEALSGWYVVQGIKFVYSVDEGVMQEIVSLIRREGRPARLEEIM